MNGYRWIGFNRQMKPIRAPKNSGGVGFFIKEEFLLNFSLKIIDKEQDGLLGLYLVHHISDFKLLLYTGYLPPENSKWGREPDMFFGHLLSKIYFHTDVDMTIFCGDLNARLGPANECIDDIDDIPKRSVIDYTKNKHGESFVEFLNQSRMCILNGRLTPLNDGFTSVSSKGAAVVDYIAISQENFTNCESFQVLPCSEIVNQCNLQLMLGDKCKLPDHSILCCTINVCVPPNEFQLDTIRNLKECANSHDVNHTKRFRIKSLPPNFMGSDSIKYMTGRIIDEILHAKGSQEEVDQIYENLCSMIYNEMENCLPCYNTSEKVKKRHKPLKPFWSEKLNGLWVNLKDKEKNLNKCKCKRDKRSLIKLYVNARHTFDREFRKAKRNYNRGNLLNLDEICTNDPNKFWESLKKLGPNRKTNIPLEIYENNEINCDLDTVLNKWKNDFSSLYNPNQAKTIGNEFPVEDSQVEVTNSASGELNKDFSLNEVKTAVLNTKNNKACGVDKIPYEVLKFDNIIEILKRLFQLCFDNGTIPQVWLKALIVPIPKTCNNDPRVPLNYRGISLLNCICKIYSSVLNDRIRKYLEQNQLLADEQNGFRANRSCMDHIYSLHSIIKNKINNNKSIFATFIDFQKAFDCVDRVMLQEKLLLKGISGKILNSIKAMYTNTTSRILLGQHMTDWFFTINGVRQGDTLAPTLFAIFINDLIVELNIL